MREIRQSGSEGGVALTTPSLPLSRGAIIGRPYRAAIGQFRHSRLNDAFHFLPD
jgi:hypothetical protein